jgi:tetratricopeptide (TPR) repeat protein
MDQGLQHLEQRAPAKAIAPLKEALNLCEQYLDDTHPLVITCLHNLADAYARCGDLQQAESLQLRALEKARSASDPDLPICLTGLAVIYTDMGRIEEAISLLEQSVQLYRSVPSEPEYKASALNNLAQLYDRTRRYAEALPLAKEAYEILVSAYGEDNENTIMALNNLGMIYYRLKQYSLACEALQRAYTLAQESDELGTSEIFGIALNYAIALHHAGETETLLSLLTRCPNILQVWKQQDPDMEDATLQHYAVHVIRETLSLGNWMHLSNPGPISMLFFVRAQRLAEMFLGDDHDLYWTVQNNLAETLTAMGRYDEAIRIHFRVLEWRIHHLGAEHANTALTMHNLASAYYHQDNFGEAEKWQQRALAIRLKVLGEFHPDTAYSMVNLGLIYLCQERYAEAEELLRRGLEVREQLWQSQPDDQMRRYELANSLANLASLYTERGLHAEAIPLIKRTEELLQSLPYVILPRILNLLKLAESLLEVGNSEEAHSVLQTSLSFAEQHLGADHKLTQRVRRWLEAI